MTFPYDSALYLDIREFIEDHLDLVEEDEYDVLTAKVFESYVIAKTKEVGYVFFVGPPRSGKTRGLEVMSSLCFNPIIAAYMSTATIYRLLNKGHATLFLDEIHQYLNDEKMTFMALLNSGQRKGVSAWLLVKKEEDYVPTPFRVYGSKFLASTKDTANALATRCIILSMMKNVRNMPLDIDTERVDKLVLRLQQYYTEIQELDIPNLKDVFIEKGFKDNRNVATFLTLAAMTPPEYRHHIIDYAKMIDDQIIDDEALSQNAELYEAVNHAWKTAESGKISINAIATTYNKGKLEQEILSNSTIGRLVNILGLRKRCRMNNGRMGRYVTNRVMKRLRRRYAPSQLTLEDHHRELKELNHLKALKVPPLQSENEGEEEEDES